MIQQFSRLVNHESRRLFGGLKTKRRNSQDLPADRGKEMVESLTKKTKDY
jgi:hypothetical protein